jgi:hypothetical protein
MATSCGIKKQKLNNSIVLPEMAFFCFDVLFCQLNQLEPPNSPDFNNDPL